MSQFSTDSEHAADAICAAMRRLSAVTYLIPEHNCKRLKQRIQRFERRSTKLHMAPDIRVIDLGEVIIERGRNVYRFRRFRFEGSAPRIGGYTFVARIEHLGEANLIARAPGEVEELPEHYRTVDALCEHCNKVRRRNDTFVLRAPEGKLIEVDGKRVPEGRLIQIGRNCLADYIRSEDIETALHLFSLMHDVINFAVADPDGPFFESKAHTSTKTFLAASFRSMRRHGWLSRTKARDEGESATADEAAFACSPRPSNPQSARGWDEAQPMPEDFHDATAALEHVASLDGKSEYEYNLKTICALGYIDRSMHEGLVASAAYVYRRHQDQVAEQKARADRKPSEHFGIVGERYVRQLQIAMHRELESDYGVTHLYVLEDHDGNRFKWFASNELWTRCEQEEPGAVPVHPSAMCRWRYGECLCNGKNWHERAMVPGDGGFFTFGVKAHDEYKGAKQTQITRATWHGDRPEIKWIDESTGQIFKTRKALRAFQESAS